MLSLVHVSQLLGAADEEPPAWDRTVDNAARCSLGVRIYCRKAALCQQPSVWIVESSTPAAAAVVAAPIRKLWPAYWSYCKLREFRMLRMCLVNDCFVTALCEQSTKNGPGLSPQISIYLRIAVTGQRGECTRPTTTSDPTPNWSHLDTFK